MSFRLLGIPVRIQPIFWVVAVMLGLPGGTSARELAELAVWVSVLLVSILVHELGHAFAMRAFGSSPSIELWGLGGLTRWGEGALITPARDVVVSLAGPFAGLALGFAVFVFSLAIAPAHGSLHAFAIRQALWVNVAWGIVNLLPVLPLDGGHVLESLATGIAGPRGRRVAHAISLLLAVSAAGFAFYSRQIWLGILALWCVSISWQRWSAPAAKPVASPAVPPWVGEGVDEAWRLLFRGDAEEATKSAAALVARIPDGPEHAAARTMALEVLAWAHIEAGDEGAALEVAKQMPQPSSELLKARLLVAEGKLAEGLARLEELAQQGGADFPVLVLSSVYVREQRPDFVLKLLRAKRPEPLSPQTQLVLTAQLFHSGYLEACLEACELGFESTQQGVFAYNAACACSRLGRVDAGIEWLERAVTSGFADAAQLDADDDIAALRADPRFQEIRTRLGPAPVQPNP